MSIIRFYKNEHGYQIGVASNLNPQLHMGIEGDDCYVIVPLKTIKELKDKDLARIVKDYQEEARLTYQIEKAQFFSESYHSETSVETIEKWRQELLEFKGKSKIIDNTILRMDSLIEKMGRREKAFIEKPEKRKTFKKIRDKVFIEIGNKQGFRCALCGAVNNLQVDHIFPLAEGGTNDLDNLQLLCRRCNSIKSDSVPEN